MLIYHLVILAKRAARAALRLYITARLRDLARTDAAIVSHLDSERAYAEQLERDAHEQIAANNRARRRLSADLARLERRAVR